jgi:hypothetical protein
MGGLIPNPHDDSVKDKLDKQFSGSKLKKLRKRINQGTESQFFTDPANARHLARISHRLKIWPEPDSQNNEPPPTTAQLKARWQFLLQVKLTDRNVAGQGAGNRPVADLIREALQVFVVTDDPNKHGPSSCTAITFDAVQAPLTSPLEYQVNIVPDVNARPANYTARITLICNQEIPANSNRDDPTPDNGEVPPEQPDFDTKSTSRRTPKKRPRKGSAKKAAKKK